MFLIIIIIMMTMMTMMMMMMMMMISHLIIFIQGAQITKAFFSGALQKTEKTQES